MMMIKRNVSSKPSATQQNSEGIYAQVWVTSLVIIHLKGLRLANREKQLHELAELPCVGVYCQTRLEISKETDPAMWHVTSHVC